MAVSAGSAVCKDALSDPCAALLLKCSQHQGASLTPCARQFSAGQRQSKQNSQVCVRHSVAAVFVQSLHKLRAAPQSPRNSLAPGPALPDPAFSGACLLACSRASPWTGSMQ